MDEKPLLDISDIDGNAFILGCRAEHALRTGGCSSTVISLFRLEAGWSTVLSLPTAQTPRSVYDRVLQAVERYCRTRTGNERSLAG